MKLLVTGGSGLLGQPLVRQARRRGHRVAAPARSELDVARPELCEEWARRELPDVVVQCAAYTDVDGAESDAGAAATVNVDGARHMARAAHHVGARIVYVSTDYVFGGDSPMRPWRVDDPTDPQGVYARTKRDGEDAVRGVGPDHLVVRTSWLYGPDGSNFVDTIRRLARTRSTLRVVADQRGRPTWAPGLAGVLLDLIETGATGTVHAADRGVATWAQLARVVLKHARADVSVVPVSTAEYGAPAPRPAYSVLDVTTTERILGRRLPAWPAQLRRHLASTPGPSTHPSSRPLAGDPA